MEKKLDISYEPYLEILVDNDTAFLPYAVLKDDKLIAVVIIEGPHLLNNINLDKGEYIKSISELSKNHKDKVFTILNANRKKENLDSERAVNTFGYSFQSNSFVSTVIG